MRRRRNPPPLRPSPPPAGRAPLATWRQVLAEPVDIDRLPFGACMARLIRLRHLRDDAGLPLVDPQQFDALVKAATGPNPLLVAGQVREALRQAQAHVESPPPTVELEPVEF
jgi:hypothetical protein